MTRRETPLPILFFDLQSIFVPGLLIHHSSHAALQRRFISMDAD